MIQNIVLFKGNKYKAFISTTFYNKGSMRQKHLKVYIYMFYWFKPLTSLFAIMTLTTLLQAVHLKLKQKKAKKINKQKNNYPTNYFHQMTFFVWVQKIFIPENVTTDIGCN